MAISRMRTKNRGESKKNSAARPDVNPDNAKDTQLVYALDLLHRSKYDDLGRREEESRGQLERASCQGMVVETLAETGGPDAAKKLLPFGWHSSSLWVKKLTSTGPSRLSAKCQKRTSQNERERRPRPTGRAP